MQYFISSFYFLKKRAYTFFSLFAYKLFWDTDTSLQVFTDIVFFCQPAKQISY